MTIFEKYQVFVNFWTFKWEFSGGSADCHQVSALGLVPQTLKLYISSPSNFFFVTDLDGVEAGDNASVLYLHVSGGMCELALVV